MAKYRIIAAHPRAAQNYISKVMIATGLRMGVGYFRRDYNDSTDDGVVSFIHKCDGSVTLHQVREPLKTIASSMTETTGTYYWLFKRIQARPPMKHFERLATYGNDEIHNNPYITMWTYYHLNRILEKETRWRYRIEDIDEVYPDICKEFGVIPLDRVPDVKRDYNTRPHGTLTWDDLDNCDKKLTDRLRKMAKKYAYNTD